MMTTDELNRTSHSDVAIVGAGPVGLETAAMLMQRGFRVTVFERGEIGQAVRSWGHVRLFTPFGMNRSDAARDLVGDNVPADDELLTGLEFADRWLMPFANALRKGVSIHPYHRVRSVGRESFRKGDRIGSPTRSDSPFRLLVEDTADGDKKSRSSIHQAGILIDCSGFISRHRWIGAGGIPCLGERELLSDRDYRIPDITGADRSRFKDRHTLVVGSGYSAITTVSALAELVESAPATTTTWITNAGSSLPVTVIANDPLEARAALANRVNDLVCQGTHRVRWLPGGTVDEITKASDVAAGTGFRVTIRQESPGHTIVGVFDNIVALPGYQPDTSPFEELQVHRCYATDGPIRLAAHLLGEGAGDCLQQSTVGVDLLKNPEPDFFVLGAASYGRNSAFLLQTGIEQSRQLVEHLSNRKANA